MIGKVKDPARKVTDPVLLSTLAKQGIDKDFVEFAQDYAPRSRGKEYSPYAKFYRDLKSGKRFMVVSGLPMVTAFGKRIEVGWLYANDEYYSKANLFSAIVKGRQVKLTCLSDQPNGTKKLDQVTYQPQLFLNGAEISPISGKPTLLDVDPVNPNYQQNVLEWDYGVCKRRIRIIEGGYKERWITSYKGKIEITHNFSGTLPVKIGQCYRADGVPVVVQVIGDREIVDTANFPDCAFPIGMGATLTVYPDVASGNTTVDGRTARHGQVETWADLKAGAGTYSDDDGNSLYVLIESTTTSERWKQIDRAIMLFDTSGLPDDAAISAATLSLRSDYKLDNLSISPTFNIFASTPASDNVLVNADYQQHGTIPFATAIAIGDWDAGDVSFNDFVFVQAGLDAISKTGITKTSLRDGTYDAGASTPPWFSDAATTIRCWTADKGAGYKPKLVVTYAGPTSVADGDLIGIPVIRKS